MAGRRWWEPRGGRPHAAAGAGPDDSGGEPRYNRRRTSCRFLRDPGCVVPSSGEPPDRDEILVRAYEQMRRLARQRLARSGPDSIQATELVNETWLRLTRQHREWADRAELFGLAARAMRDILVDRAREKGALKRGGDWERVNWDSALQVASEHPEELLALDRAVTRLREVSDELGRIVELMFYAGLTGEETADALGVSASTVDRRWRFARAWLHRELAGV